ncbi:hypothetical protein LCGC14_0403210 [marine sediment metagenome]|uniref:Uncharacterized protein n=1 Tax=marine sediment metagenome TaxID=412755 RepID=A0A0F9T1P7_9ZZZZ
MEKAIKPHWWPENPYPEAIFPMHRDEYTEIVPNPRTRTALSGCLGREFWDIASETIFHYYKTNRRLLQETRQERIAKATKPRRTIKTLKTKINALEKAAATERSNGNG